ncbi:MAG TPA: hypothetical protein VGL63_00395 [Streptosporangiaceae bacterium]
MPGGRGPGELLRIVEARLAEHGLRVRRLPGRSRLARVSAPVSVIGPAVCRDAEVIVEDDGYVEWRYWPPADRPADPVKIADLIADVLTRDLTNPLRSDDAAGTPAD